MIGCVYIGSTGPEPDLGWGRITSVEFVVEVAQLFIIVLVAHLVPRESRMSPPSVEEEAEEEGIDGSGIKVRSMDIENSVSLHCACGSP